MTDPSVKGHAQEWKIKVKQIRGTVESLKNVCPFNPLTSESDWHVISTNHITPESNIKVRRMKELITDQGSS